MTLLRRRSADGVLCCNDENSLEVERIDRDGFVTVVNCTSCYNRVETVCRNVSWTYEKVDESRLKKGDHICWHRPYAIWHHAIVTGVETDGKVRKLRIVHYSRSMRVEETEISEAATCHCCGCLGDECNSLYRVNYEDCYDNEYTAMRAKKLLRETRYNLIGRNCEHFIRWCKTGSTSSSQISIAWTSLGKVALTIGLKAVGLLVVLGLLQYAHESQEEMVRDRPFLERMQNILLSVYIAVMTGVFVVYLMKTSCSRLGRVIRRDDVENPCSKLYQSCRKTRLFGGPGRFCCGLLCACFADDAENPCGDCAPTKNSTFGTRLYCCLFFCCFWIVRRLFCDACKHIQCRPCTCCQRHGHLAGGLLTRIFTRELLAAVATLVVVLNEEQITNQDGILQLPALARTTFLVFLALIAHVVGYILGAFIGRWAEALCLACCKCCCQTPATAYRNFP